MDSRVIRWAGSLLAVTAAVGGLVAVGPNAAGAAEVPTIVATPSQGLRDGQTVSVTGSGFAPVVDLGSGPRPGQVALVVCLARVAQNPLNAFELCGDASSEAPVAADGRIAGSVTARRISTGFIGNTVDCTTGPGACVLFAQQIVGFSSPRPIPDVLNAWASISFRAEQFSDCRDNAWQTFTDRKGRPFRSRLGCYVSVFVSKLLDRHRSLVG
jgi:hypothetical protein